MRMRFITAPFLRSAECRPSSGEGHQAPHRTAPRKTRRNSVPFPRWRPNPAHRHSGKQRRQGVAVKEVSTMRKFFEIGGVVAAAVLVAFCIAAIVMGAGVRSRVNSSLKQEFLVGTPDMTPAAIAAEAKKAGLPASIKLPTTSVAGKVIDTGSEARAFAQYMRI